MMKKEKSCGAIIYHESDGIIYYLVAHSQFQNFTLIKGHVEGNETDEETALREIMEEVGLSVVIDTRFCYKITYSPSNEVLKDVYFFVAKTKTPDFKVDGVEIEDAYWLEYKKAEELLSYKNYRDALSAANVYLLRQKSH
jgi:bis(5'-nucleosidyl)-tetraphosphatase